MPAPTNAGTVESDADAGLLGDVLFRGLLDAAPDAMVAVNVDGGIELVNEQAERLFGYQREELLGQSVEILVPERARGLHRGLRAEYAEDPRPRPMGAKKSLAARRKDGTEFPAEISLSALETDRGLLILAAVRDVTDAIRLRAEHERLEEQAARERLERQLQQAQRLESLGQLAGGVAHDFNNLLGVILNYAAFVGEELEKAPDAERWAPVRADVEEIVKAAQRAAQLTRQLLAFARRDVVHARVLNLADVVAGVLQLLKRTLGEHVELNVQLANDLWPIRADPGQLEQVLVNLAVNARDAMPGGGRLTIDAENIYADDEFAAQHPGLRAGRCVRLRVSDDGPGMDAETRARAFEPFFTTKPRGEGTGLGLATVYGVVTQAGGSVSIYSEEGFGTTISIVLPAADQAETSDDAPAEAAPQAHHGGERILVVEDEGPLRDVTCRVLRGAGYDVIAASNGPEALELAESAGHIDLLLTDVVMPKMLGKELAQRMSADRPGLAVVYMSGYAAPLLESSGGLEDGVTLVEKPFSSQDLLTKIREVLDGGPS